MYPNQPDQSNSANDTSTEAWFNSISSPELPPTPPPTPRRSKSKLFLKIAILSTIIVVALSAGLFTVSRFVLAKACLDESAYSELTGTSLEETLYPKEVFYVKTIDFEEKKDAFTATTKDDTNSFISKLARLYKERSGDTSIVITLSSDYLDEDGKQLAEKRLVALSSELTGAGISPSSLKTQKPQRIDAGETDIPSLPSYITINSSQDCRE